MGIPKRGFLVSLSLTFLFGYASSNVVNFFLSNIRFYEDYNHERIVTLLNQMKIMDLLLQYGRPQEVVHQLKEASDMGLVDFYLFQSKGSAVAQEGNLSDLHRIKVKPGEMLVDEQLNALAVERNGHYLVIGVHKDRWRYLTEVMRRSQGALFFDIFLVVLMAIGIAVFFAKDFRQLISILQKG